MSRKKKNINHNRNSAKQLLSVVYQFRIKRTGYLADDQDSQGDDLLGVEGWK